ncbi:hypothetical protein PINS_up020227 [Pythium insidiosum]|nr:hypothetical protein PINS_up020227 [Pythium insidiosum]
MAAPLHGALPSVHLQVGAGRPRGGHLRESWPHSPASSLSCANKTSKYEGLQFNDLLFCLGLVSRAQQDERQEQEDTEVEVDTEAATRRRFPATIEKTRLCDLAFTAVSQSHLWAGPVYFWYTPLRWFKIFSCWSKSVDGGAGDRP